VADNGPGIPDAIRENLFQPFVSYGKEKGIGLGLTAVQKIMQDRGGEVCVESTGPEGTVFKLRPPAAVQAESAALPYLPSQDTSKLLPQSAIVRSARTTRVTSGSAHDSQSCYQCATLTWSSACRTAQAGLCFRPALRSTSS
jgi:histidine kinase/DNA gyrase B/HSP90-like ATPase